MKKKKIKKFSKVKKLTKVRKLKKTTKVIKRRPKKSLLSRFLPSITIFSLLVLALIGIVSQKPIVVQLPNSEPSLPKQLSLRITVVPSPTNSVTKSHALVARAQAAASEGNDYCLNVSVLFYHHVEPLRDAQKAGHAQFTVDNGIFDQQMSYLKEHGYMTVPVDTIVDGITNKKMLHPKTVALTFDDGYADMYTYVYPILKKYGFVGNFAISTGLLENSGYMNWAQVTEIARDPAMRIYNHTSSHVDLINHPSQTELEISTAQNDIQNRLGLRSNIFFYPYGTFNQTVISALRSKGYIAAFSTLPGTLQCESSLMYLSRTRIGNAPLSFYGL